MRATREPQTAGKKAVSKKAAGKKPAAGKAMDDMRARRGFLSAMELGLQRSLMLRDLRRLQPAHAAHV